jgi:dephospho-CoA kinase
MNLTQIKRIGLTGGIGSGKSTLAGLLARSGVHLIDADAISRELTAAGGAAMPEITKTFGPAFVAADGSMDRAHMRQFVFNNEQARLQLQSILHPLIAQAMQDKLFLLSKENISLVLIDIPLLVESAYWRSQMHKVLVVDCSVQTQVRRVMKRSLMSEQEVLNIIAHQVTRARRVAAADWVIHNDTDDLSVLEQQVNAIQLHF